jgi:glucose/arabinose dehydrogenase
MRSSRVISATVLGLSVTVAAAYAQTVRDEKLSVRTIVSGLDAPSTMAFIGANDILVAEKNTGKVQRVAGGVVAGLYEIFRVR